MSETAFTYTPVTTSSGMQVEIRSRTYTEWEAQEEQRLKSLEGVAVLEEEDKKMQAELAMQRAGLSMRNARLATWVKNFDKVKSSLTVHDITEIEKAALKLEQEEIPLGNSESGGDGR